jgi:hypothetical protein
MKFTKLCPNINGALGVGIKFGINLYLEIILNPSPIL